jgi:hypothetical protein
MAEIQFFENIIARNPEHADKPKKWHAEQLKPFKKFLYKRKLTRRRNNLKLKQRTYIDACVKFEELKTFI